MVNGSAELNKLFEQYLNCKLKGRKRFELEELETFLIKKTGGMSTYQSAGGYQALYQLLKEKEEKGRIKAIKSSTYNSRQPVLKSRWQLVVKNAVQVWQDQLIFQLSRQLDLRYYLKRPWLQTKELAERLLRLAEFLCKKNDREWASREERSLELFADEKFLSTAEGRKFLSSLSLNLAALKAEKYSQMFVYWNKGTMIKKILILENHSAFIACKRALTADYNIFSYAPDTLIYGEGKHIIESFKFLDELLAHLEKENRQQVEVKYAGDIDPEGWLIYYRLKEKYPEYKLELFAVYYREMIKQGSLNAYPINSQQNKNNIILEKILGELKKAEDVKASMVDRIEQLWNEDLRLPEELITYEVLTNKRV
ncbi:cytosolic protein [Iocasia frigidifontis]|uniref:Cytosolic protein n=1 Tax=Iocasia fonsfrigidae TaxID=2682810 RepID=A0A8A7K8M8_9FIRM|nr:hypothetical protein [Iocasia fonsfrigidae]QTL97560.1 cytosolic protein [Iocasia fonsfrigidae]